MTKYWTIKEFSKLTKVTVRTLHFYDKQDLLVPHHRSEAGYRFYSQEDLQALQKITVLKNIGFNLKQIRAILAANQLDWISSLTLQAKVIQDNIAKLEQGLLLINHSMNLYSQHNTIDWQAIATLLEVFKMTNDTMVHEWSKRNFSTTEINFFTTPEFQQQKTSGDELWLQLFTEAKALMHLEPSAQSVQELARKWMDSANSQYNDNPALGKKMWELMKSGDIPEGLIPGYEQNIVLFMNQAIAYLYSH
jgi:DNA-binding transcriptional MerR regulator